ncbi:MAG: DUF4212 domain-containing protein [Aquincola sp.]|uniref:DUF4212 domain-containing protein n=1 Tax=uncultured Aquincola sp. TaxID=886556 RepID=UPI0032B30712|nr:DUF4212 domain-containing protein [Aquincola sp.]
MAPEPTRPADPPAAPAAPAGYWQRNRRLIGVLLLVWSAVTFCALFFARELSFQWLNWPFSFWFAAQGALVMYVLIIALYARVMNRADEAARGEP